MAKDALINKFAEGLLLGRRKTQVMRMGVHASIGSRDAQNVNLGTNGIAGRAQGRIGS